VDDAGKLVGILTTTDALEALTWFSRQARDAAEQGAPPLGSPRFPS
jgi:CBS-domain-containing membrane protein